MPRRKNFSGKAKRAELRIKNAEKRGEAAPEDIADWLVGHKLKRQPVHERKSDLIIDAGKLESAFLRLSADYRDVTMRLAFATRIERPVPPARAAYPADILERDRGGGLTCPVRPRFRPGQSKKEVERNEEGMYRRWLLATRAKVDEYLNPPTEVDEEDDGANPDYLADEEDQWPRSPPWFETNLEVWRQLWRVTELSHIVLLLLDARCPPLHCPTSLKTYLQGLKPWKEIVLVLTKSDLVDPRAVQAWRTWVKGWWEGDADTVGAPGVQVIAVKSLDTEAMERGKQKPHLPTDILEQLVAALRTAHKRLLEPPHWARDDPEKLARWSPTVREVVDWTALLRGDVGPAHPHQSLSEDDMAPTEGNIASAELGPGHDEPLTIGLVGQPNVGKSSLLNALLGETKVRASRTPGKTKHFQTMFWGSARHVKIVDCPGLVCPSLAPHELQALAGILPISQIPSLPSCIHFAAKRMPLEDIFNLDLPEREKDPYAAKKTWRHPPPSTTSVAPDVMTDPVVETKKDTLVTAGSIMETRALARGYITAKGGRPDTNRAANGIMRMLADGKVRWGFWPDGAAPTADVAGKGIWLASSGRPHDVESDDDPEPITHHADGVSYSEGEDDDDSEYTDIEEEEADEVNQEATTAGRFAALNLEDEPESASGSDEDGGKTT